MSEIIPTDAELKAENAKLRKYLEDYELEVDHVLKGGRPHIERIAELEAALEREKLHAAQWALLNEELEAKLDAVEIDNLGHAHALSMLRGLFGLPLDGTLYDEIWQKHLELMEADNARLRAVVDHVQWLVDGLDQPCDAKLAQLLGKVEGGDLIGKADAATSRICGRCVEAGNDDAGQSRLVIHTTREQLMQFGRNLAFADVEVTLQTQNTEVSGSASAAPTVRPTNGE